jgi:tagaturonate reductase
LIAMLRIAVLQFGGGNFLRAFTDLFLHQANTNQEVGRAVVVTSTESDRTRLINAQSVTYHVVVRGLSGGQQINETIRVDGAIDRALSATSQWPEIRQTARSTDLRWIVSNTTEAGLQLAPEEITAWQLEGATRRGCQG